MRTILRTRLVAVAALILAVGSRAAPARAPASQPPDIVFIVVDTLRRDHVGVYGNERARTPYLDSLAARAVVFDRAFAQAPWTAPSVASMFTSRYQSQHGIITFSGLLSEDELTLAEILHDNGYATAGFSANLLLQGGWGYSQGFDDFGSVASIVPNESPKGSAASVNARALGWLDGLGDDRPPVFLYLHYMEPHIPYQPPEDLLVDALGGRPRPDVAAINAAVLHRYSELTDEELQQATLLYEVGVADLDRRLRDLFGELGKRGISDDALVVFTADHGEEMYEHGWWGHGMSLYNDVIRVPLLIGMPRQTVRADVAENVALIDIAPTILDVAGIAAPPTFEGRSLARVPRANPASADGWLDRALSVFAGREPAVASENLPAKGVWRPTKHERAIVVGRSKLIRHLDGNSESYDLQRDPDEKDPVRSFDGIPSFLQFGMADFVDRVGSRTAPTRSTDLDAAARERMRALGYTE